MPSSSPAYRGPADAYADHPLAAFVAGLPKAELHVHQVGSASPEIVAALAERHVPHAYVPFAGEQHGFRQAQNVRTALDSELSFYAQVLAFELPAAEGIPPVRITNLI